MKKLWIGILVAVGLLGAALLTLFLLTPEVRDSGDTGSRYPYSYTDRKNGLDITITGEVPEDCHWVPELGSSTAVSAEVTKSSSSQTVIALRTNHAGTANLRIFLQKEADLLTDRTYELDISLLVDSEGNLRVIDNDHKEHAGVESGSLSGKDYSVAQLDDGRLAVQVQDPELWAAETEQETVGIYVEGGLFYIEGFDEGEDTVLLYHTEGTDALALKLTVQGGAVNLDSVSRTEAPKTARSFTNLSLFTEMYGRPVAPDGAELLDADVQIWKSFSEPGLEIAVGVLTYNINGEHWELLYTGQSRLEDLLGELAAGEPEARSGTVQGIFLQAYDNGEKAAAGCILEDGTALMIQGEGFTSDLAYARLSEIITVMYHG